MASWRSVRDVRHRPRSRRQPLSSEVTPNALRGWVSAHAGVLGMFRSTPCVPTWAAAIFS